MSGIGMISNVHLFRRGPDGLYGMDGLNGRERVAVFVMVNGADIGLHEQELKGKENVVEREHRLPIGGQDRKTDDERMWVDVGMEHRMGGSDLRRSEGVVFADRDVEGEGAVTVIALFGGDGAAEIM